jgi:hypothetical protein
MVVASGWARCAVLRTTYVRAESALENLLSWFPAEHLKRTGVNISHEQLDQPVLEAKSRHRFAPCILPE